MERRRRSGVGDRGGGGGVGVYRAPLSSIPAICFCSQSLCKNFSSSTAASLLSSSCSLLSSSASFSASTASASSLRRLASACSRINLLTYQVRQVGVGWEGGNASQAMTWQKVKVGKAVQEGVGVDKEGV